MLIPIAIALSSLLNINQIVNWVIISSLFYVTEVTQFFDSLILFQSDVVHQSVFELVHSEDREELQRQLVWNSFLTPDQAAIPLQVVQKISGHKQKIFRH